jgi:magnesium-protoporphyrin O-methyltransferase
VAGCCDPRRYDQIFGARFARRSAARYRTKGLDTAASRMVELLAEQGLDGATVLEIGGGVGDLQIELLRRGAARATNLELSPGYEAEAARLLQEAGLADRVTRRQADIVADPTAAEPADVVVLHRVVCCYPDYARLLGAAADHARRHLVFSHPPRNAISRTVIGTQNALLRLARREFRAFAHPPADMLATLAEHGMRVTAQLPAPVWQVVAVSR